MINPVPLWTSAQAAAATGGAATRAFSAQGVAIDSRTLAPGDLFVALSGPGLARDGHDFVADALNRGAAAALVSRAPAGLAPDAPLLIVSDTQAALEALGVARRAETPARIVAVTGSVGKTGTKEALRHVLARQGATHASAASYNNLWGVPLSLARMPRTTRFGAFEIGMNHAGEITPLTRQVRPDVAIVTTVEAVHLEFFPSVSAIADAKAEIFSGLSGGVAIINRDNAYADQLIATARGHAGTILTFGEDPRADIRLTAIDLDGEGSTVTIDLAGRRLAARIGLPGRHVAMNCLAVLCAVDALGADAERAAEDLADLGAVEGRGLRHVVKIDDGTLTLVDESYNASPPSIRAALAVLGASARDAARVAGRRIAVFGDMRELGPAADDLHSDLAPDVARDADLLFACGPHMRALFDAVPAGMRGAWAPDSRALAPLVTAALRPGDVVMVKGSLGSAMKVVVDAVRALEG